MPENHRNPTNGRGSSPNIQNKEKNIGSQEPSTDIADGMPKKEFRMIKRLKTGDIYTHNNLSL